MQTGWGSDSCRGLILTLTNTSRGSRTNFPVCVVSMWVSYGVTARSSLGWWIHADRCLDQPDHRNMGPPTELPLRPPPPPQTPNWNQHVSADGPFDVLYVPLVYVNMNKGTLSLVCVHSGRSQFTAGVFLQPRNKQPLENTITCSM